jgi:hypothetical protein
MPLKSRNRPKIHFPPTSLEMSELKVPQEDLHGGPSNEPQANSMFRSSRMSYIKLTFTEHGIQVSLLPCLPSSIFAFLPSGFSLAFHFHLFVFSLFFSNLSLFFGAFLLLPLLPWTAPLNCFGFFVLVLQHVMTELGKFGRLHLVDVSSFFALHLPFSPTSVLSLFVSD